MSSPPAHGFQKGPFLLILKNISMKIFMVLVVLFYICWRKAIKHQIEGFLKCWDTELETEKNY